MKSTVTFSVMWREHKGSGDDWTYMTGELRSLDEAAYAKERFELNRELGGELIIVENATFVDIVNEKSERQHARCTECNHPLLFSSRSMCTGLCHYCGHKKYAALIKEPG